MKSIIIFLLVAFSLAACTNYGKKVKVEGTKGEVFYKGEGVTESDAKKTGEFLKKINYLSSEKEASIQITKQGEEYTMRFVYNKSVYDSMSGAEDAFKKIGVRASKEVFDGKKVNIALTTKNFKDFKNIPFDEATAKALYESQFTIEDYDHDEAGGVKFYWKDISDNESKRIADYIVENGSFRGENSEIFMSKEGDRYILMFPVVASAVTNPDFLANVELVTKQIKDNVFANVPFSFYVTDIYMKKVKSWDY